MGRAGEEPTGGEAAPTGAEPGPTGAEPATAGADPESPSGAVADFDAIEKGFRSAQAAYVIPDKMIAGQSSHVHLDLSFQKTLDDLQRDLQEHLPKETVKTTSIRSSSVAQARLTGQNFEITAVTPEEQPVSSKTTSWEWEVRPKRGGRHPLHLSIDAVVRIGPDARTWTIKTFEKSVLVRVSASAWAKAFVANNWQWLWTTLAVPIGGLLWAKRRKKTKRKRRPTPRAG